MRTVIYLTVCLMLIAPAQASYRPGAINLRGQWGFCPVAPMIDLVPDRYVRPDFPQLSPAWDEVIDPQAVPPSDAQWMDVTVPMAWENYTHPGYNEAGWYKKTISIPGQWLAGQPVSSSEFEAGATGQWVGGKRFWLEFEAVATAAGVWVNGEYIGAHVGDYSPWRLEITSSVSSALTQAAHERMQGEGSDPIPSSLEIWVYVDELPGHITQGFLSMIAPHHGGIWQGVTAYSTGAVCLSTDGVYISTDWANQSATVELSFDGPWNPDTDFPLVSILPIGKHTSNLTLYSSMLDTDLKWDYNQQTQVLTMVCNLAGQELVQWSPDVPALYQATVSLPGKGTGTGAGDHTLKHFGFRDIRMEGSSVLLNGEPIKIRSVLNWGYYPGVFGPAPSPQTVREEFAYIKSLGFNAETVCLVNMPDYFYTIADQMGVLVWQEYPTWHNDFDAKHLATYRSEFPAYLQRDRNHPSIIMRSLSVEAGVADWDVIDGLYAMTKAMTDTPVQDNNSWFSHSRPEYTDWYGEDNYFNNAQWARHLLERLPQQLDGYPEKPYIIGESILFNTWPDIDALEEFLGSGRTPNRPEEINGTASGRSPQNNQEDGLVQGPASTHGRQGGKSAPPLQVFNWQPPEGMPAYLGGPSDYPWWFPSCYESCKEINAKLRERYNSGLPEGKDIVNDYLLPQSTRYALESRRFQIEMLDSDPRYSGYTVNCVRDMPLIRAGLLDSLEQPRWTPEQWAWHGSEALIEAAKPDDFLSKWDPDWDGKLISNVRVLALRDGYIDLESILISGNVRWIDDWELDETRGVPLPTEYSQVVVTSVLTHKLVDYMVRGGVVILLTSKWPGGLGSYHHYFWRDAIFVPPVGPWKNARKLYLTGTMELHPGKVIGIPSPLFLGMHDEIVSQQPFSLNFETTDVIPVESLGIVDSVDPLLRLYDTHDLSNVVTYDQVFATKVGEGLFFASSLDHSTRASKHVLGKLASWAKRWLRNERYAEIKPYLDAVSEGKEVVLPKVREFPQTSISVQKLHELAVSRPNGILPLDEGWAFSLDEAQVGESAGWMLPGYDVAAWDTLRAGAGWESQGYSYDGMAWYICEIDVPENWAGGKLRLVAEGIDDAYTVWVNGEAVATHGSFTVHEETVWLQQTVTDLTGYLIPGETNTLALQVVDIVGQGGIWRPIYLEVDDDFNRI